MPHFEARPGGATGTPALVPAVLYMFAEFESVSECVRTADEQRHIRLCHDLNWRVKGLEFYETKTEAGAEYHLVSTCCKSQVQHLPSNPDDMVRCATCGRDHGLAKHVQALGSWLLVESQRQKRPLNRHARRRVEGELARR